MKTRHELLMLLLVVFTGVAFGFYSGFGPYSRRVLKADEAALKQDLLLLREALDRYHDDMSRYPARLEVLVTDRYLRAIPTDPFTNSPQTWQLTRATAEPGVVDVRSGSARTAIDGSRYSEW